MGQQPTDEGVAGATSISRRRWLGLAGVLGLSGAGAAAVAATNLTGADSAAPEASAASGPSGVLGANFNGDPSTVTFRQLEEISASWLRGFFLMPDADEGDPAEQPSLRMLLNAADQGYGTVLSLKFPYDKRRIPAPESPAMRTELARLDKVLPVVLGRVRVLAVGNEPFIESKDEDHTEALNVFYEALARHVIEHRERQPGNNRTRLYMGALNRLDLPAWKTPVTERWLKFVRDTPELDGVDIHPHVPKPEDSRKYLDYVLPRLRPEQKFLATEFSLVLLWKQHLTDPAPPEFLRKYRIQGPKKVWEVLRMATEQWFPQQQWNDFLAMSPWFEKHKHFLREQTKRFRDTGRLAVATYGVGQDAPMVADFDEHKMPWLLNSLFASRTVQPGPDGLPGRGYSWIEDFRAAQRKQDQRPVR